MRAAIVPAPDELLSAGLNSAHLDAMMQAEEDLDFAASDIGSGSEEMGVDFQTISAGIMLGTSHKVGLRVLSPRIVSTNG